MNPFGTDYSFQMVGARLLGPDPIRDVWLPLDSGVHAFYGKNGAGKSRLLQALAGLYGGRPLGAGYLVVRAVHRHEGAAFGFAPIHDRDLIESPPAQISGLTDHNARSMLTALWEAWGAWTVPIMAPPLDDSPDSDPYLEFDYSELDDVDDLDDDDRASLFADIEQLSAGDDDQHFEPPFSEADLLGLLDEITQQRLFALTFDGEFWLVTPAVRIDSGTPRLWSERERCRTPAAYPFDDLVSVLAATDDQIDFRLLDRAEVVPYRLGPNSAMGGLRLTTEVGSSPLTVVMPDHERLSDLDDKVRSRLVRIAADDNTPHVDHRGKPPVAWEHELERLNKRLMGHLASFFISPPDVGVRVRPPHMWFTGESTEWFAHDGYREIALSNLSEAHQR